MKNYYKIFDISKTATDAEISEIYKFKVSQFFHLPFLTSQMKEDIKELKIGMYILLNKERREKYNIILDKDNTDKKYIDNTQICNRIFNL